VGSIQEAAALLDRSRSFLYDSLKRRQREWATADWVGYGREVRRRRLLAGWSVSQMSRIINLSPHTLRRVEAGRGPLRPSDLTLAKLATALGMPLPPPSEPPVRQKAPSK
jgi:ribosome-binding protein aMBF1 (putative translation factor)